MRRAILAAVIAVAAPALAADGQPALQRMRFAERGADLTVTTSIAQLFDSTAYEALGSGFPSTVVIRFWTYDRASSDPIAFHLIQRKVIYDLWDEVYLVDLGAGGRPVKVKERSKAFTLLASLDAVPVAPLDAVPFEDHHVLAIVAELNPVSKETLAEVRRWLSQGNGGGLDRGGSFFGSFVSVFVNPKVAESDRALRLRSQPFYRPRRKGTP